MTEETKSPEKILWEQEVLSDVTRIETLLACGIFEPKNRRSPLVQSAFIELMICLNDLLAKAKKETLRINFTDDVVISTGIKDVTDLVAVIRNAACHIPSQTRYADDSENRIMFYTVYGRQPAAFLFEKTGQILGCNYDDDIAFLYGNQKIYFQRHIRRAFAEVSEKLKPLVRYYQRPEQPPEP